MHKRKTTRRARRKRAPARVERQSSDPRALAARLFRLLEAEIRASEVVAERLRSLPDAAGTAERTRTLGALARALQTAASLSEATTQPSEDESHDPAFRSVEELGRAISRHLEEMELERAGELPRKAETG
jgi:hypothetical protein